MCVPRSFQHCVEHLPSDLRPALAAAAFLALAATSSFAQQIADPGFKSVGRGAPLARVLETPPRANEPAVPAGEAFKRYVDGMRRYPFVGAMNIPLNRVIGGSTSAGANDLLIGSASDGAAPPGVTPADRSIHLERLLQRPRTFGTTPATSAATALKPSKRSAVD